jgi:D-citramalate synthase
VTLEYQGRVEKAEAQGDGGYDSLMNALRKAVKPFDVEIPRLEDFRSRIPPGGRTGALVETVITWRRDVPGSRTAKRSSETFSTLGVDSDQLAAAVIATEKMLNAVVPKPRTASPRKRQGGRAQSRPTSEARRRRKPSSR